MSGTHQLANDLRAAILAGNELEANRLAEQLCSGAGVRVYPDPLPPSIDPLRLVSVVLLTRCSRVSQPLHLVMPAISTAVTIADLKRELLLRFDIPIHLQTCIVGQEAPPDDAPLAAGRLQPVRVFVRCFTDWRPPPDELRRLKKAARWQRERHPQQQLQNSAISGEDEVNSNDGWQLVAGPCSSESQRWQRQSPTPLSQPAGWACSACTYLNEPTRLGCEMCSAEPPPGYRPVAPAHAVARQAQLEREFLEEHERQRRRNLSEHLALASCSLIPAIQDFECPICITEVPVRAGSADHVGVQLRDCGHEVCAECLRQHLLHADALPVRCPHDQCQQTVTEAEAAQLLSSAELDRLQRLGLRQAEAVIPNTFHCVAPDCEAFVELAEEVNSFVCLRCGEHNCVTCRASHNGVSCRQFQDQLRRDAQNNKAAELTLAKLEKMVQSGEAMNCPNCCVFLQKKEGCDWLMCSMCQTEICWATRGRRWGPGGKGDTSAGCRCRVNNMLCHPKCQNCH